MSKMPTVSPLGDGPRSRYPGQPDLLSFVGVFVMTEICLRFFHVAVSKKRVESGPKCIVGDGDVDVGHNYI